ncbi:hypothetical protein ABB37_04073 [Leptomonas pyrrhocoris]|uniref:Uncharacterized protein n=1 Tax=Leptomonas pyrrhocoris TaxID=157538 RepID=A0A0M9G416_LEPPY|nr:hypothetical protein ABB37_04073 [Leptomonas pyrrhocoris]KPA81803.1 hypothetical protein ABB37_04073 [Leptomonas pyrrhocoris]|eukprot:XP_015660242.1 hypothetical protein ABB37_04073 [Leptomonas pyrrhocoris]
MSEVVYTSGNPVGVVPFLTALTDYQKKGVGVDMMLKALLNVSRLCMLYSTNLGDKRKFFKLADTIVECRMLCNFGRPVMTFHQAMSVLGKRSYMEFWHCLFTCLAFFLRVPEQLSGDMNFLQKVVFRRWSREKLSFCYRFFKSWSLTCGLLAELTRRSALKRAVRSAVTPEENVHTKLELQVSNALIIRTLCDMYVYFKWIPGYEPIKAVEYSCGLASGLIGVLLVWKDTRYVLPPMAKDVQPCERCGHKHALQRAVCVLDSEGGGSEGGASADEE